MPEESRRSYPRLGVKSWWEIRKRFKQTIPTTVDSRYLAAVLHINEKSAEKNILPFLKTIGIVDSKGVPTELAKRWRDEKDYPQVCKEISERIYPKGLIEAVPDPSENRQDAIRWFMSKTGVGEAAAEMMTSFYALIQKADSQGEKEIQTITKTPKKEESIKKESKKTAKAKERGKPEHEESKVGENKDIQIPPSIHLDIQIHVASDASADLLDRLFASMAKHLKDFYSKKSL